MSGYFDSGRSRSEKKAAQKQHMMAAGRKADEGRAEKWAVHLSQAHCGRKEADCLQWATHIHSPSPLDCVRRPYGRRFKILRAAGEQFGDAVENDEEAGLHVRKGDVEVGEMGDEDEVLQDERADIGERHGRGSSPI